MAIFELAADALRPITETTCAAAGIRERGVLQRLLRTRAARQEVGEVASSEQPAVYLLCFTDGSAGG